MTLYAVQLLFIAGILHLGKGNETDPTNASANVLADTPPTCWPTHHRRVGRHITNASAELKGKIASNQNTKRKSIDDAIFNCDTRT